MDVNSLVKRFLGNAYNARSEQRVFEWIDAHLEVLPEGASGTFVEVILKGRDPQEVADQMGLSILTVRQRVRLAIQILSALARSMPPSRFRRLFKSVYEHKFGEKVRAKELTRCLFGRYNRRGTQAITVRYISKVESGELDLPMPGKEGKFWIWSKRDAEVWRDWFAQGDWLIGGRRGMTNADG